MRSALSRSFRVAFGGLTAALLGIAIGAPSHAQTVGEVTVRASRGPYNNVRSLSYPVSFRDLDLRTETGRDQLSHRISITADYLCGKLGEGAGAAPPLDCRSSAERDAMAQARAAENQALASAAPWTPGPAWTPPGGK